MPGGPCQLENELVDAAGQTGEPTHPKLKVALSGKKKKKKNIFHQIKIMVCGKSSQCRIGIYNSFGMTSIASENFGSLYHYIIHY